MKITYQAYPITTNKVIIDTNVIEYEFRNYGNTHVFINGIHLPPKPEIFSIFRENLNYNQTSFGDYNIKFVNLDNVLSEINYLLVIEKRKVDEL